MVHLENTFNGFNILSYPSGMYVNILEYQERLMNDSLQRHSKVIQIRFDLHYPSGGSIIPSFHHISSFTEIISKRFKRMNISSHRLDLHYLWAREMAGASYPHYHFLVWINANAIQNMYTIFKIATEVWCKVLNTTESGLVHYCLNENRNHKYDNGIIIDRNSDDYEYSIQEAFRSGSYLSKVDTKDNLNKFERKFGHSKI